MSSSTEIEHKRKFLQVFRRWEALFKRVDKRDELAEKWFVAEYYKSLRHLSIEGFEVLTEKLKEKCTFFPTVKECLDIVNVSEHSYDWGNPFRKKHGTVFLVGASRLMIEGARPLQQISQNAPILPDRGSIEDEID